MSLDGQQLVRCPSGRTFRVDPHCISVQPHGGQAAGRADRHLFQTGWDLHAGGAGAARGGQGRFGSAKTGAR